MPKIPEEFELLSFFEVEPSKLDEDPNFPFFYNSLQYNIVNDSERIEVHLSPAYGDMEIIWEQQGPLKFNWRVYHIESLQIEKKDGLEYLIIKSKDENIADCYLWVKPHFKIIGGMNLTT